MPAGMGSAPDSGCYAQHLAALQGVWSRALELAGCDAVLVHSGVPPRVFLDDQTYPYRANAHFRHWVPVLDNPDCFVLFRPGAQPVLLFHQPIDFWHQPAAWPDADWTRHFDIRLIRDAGEARAHLPHDAARLAFVGAADPRFGDWPLACRNPPALLDCLHYHRGWKTGYEIACLRQASRLGALAHRAAAQAFRAGASEYEIHLAYLAACAHNERDLPYASIVALNEHAAVLHYQHQTRQRPARRHSLLIDAGAQHHGYACDITRTHTTEDGAFAELLAAMDTGQQALCEALTPGLEFVDLQYQAERLVAGLLSQFGLIHCDPDGALERGLVRYFFPHGVGHFLGLQVHDAGGLLADEHGARRAAPAAHPLLRLTRTLEAAQVVTVEPGLYFIEPLLAQLRDSPLAREVDWARVDALRPCGGVRIEDDALVTTDGHENLTRRAFAAAPQR